MNPAFQSRQEKAISQFLQRTTQLQYSQEYLKKFGIALMELMESMELTAPALLDGATLIILLSHHHLLVNKINGVHGKDHGATNQKLKLRPEKVTSLSLQKIIQLQYIQEFFKSLLIAPMEPME